MENFTPLSAAIGGALIGLSAALLWVAMGRIAGISGILGGLIGGMGTTRSREITSGAWPFWPAWWRPPCSTALAAARLPEPSVTTAPGLLIAAGLLVGIRHPPGKRLHQRPRRLRSGPALPPLAGRHGALHGQRRRNRVRRPSPDRSLTAMPSLLVALASGLLFGLGLTVSAMIDPAKVLEFSRHRG